MTGAASEPLATIERSFGASKARLIGLLIDPAAWVRPDAPLSMAEHQRAEGFRRAEDRARFIAGRCLLREALALLLGLAPAAVPLVIDGQGRPVLASGPSFSLSHAGGAVLLGLAEDPAWRIGVDVEPADRALDAAGLAPLVLTAGERAWLEAQPSPSLGFLRLWTMKEAALKAAGLGLGLDPRRLELRVEPPALWSAEPALAGPWMLALADPWSGYLAALAMQKLA